MRSQSTGQFLRVLCDHLINSELFHFGLRSAELVEHGSLERKRDSCNPFQLQ